MLLQKFFLRCRQMVHSPFSFSLMQKFMPELLQHIESGALNPELIITHTLRLHDAAEGYKIFDKKEQDCRKVVLIP